MMFIYAIVIGTLAGTNLISTTAGLVVMVVLCIGHAAVVWKD
jgi:hypothetical protein